MGTGMGTDMDTDTGTGTGTGVDTDTDTHIEKSFDCRSNIVCGQKTRTSTGMQVEIVYAAYRLCWNQEVRAAMVYAAMWSHAVYVVLCNSRAVCMCVPYFL